MALRRWPEALTAVAPQLVRNPSLLVPLAQRLVPSVKLRSPQRDSATAFVRSLPQPDYPCYLLTIGVAPPAQGTPVAADLTHALLDQLRSEGLAQVALYTRVQNRRAQAFFGKMGFEQVASEGEGESAALIYVRSL
jgi:ribosomal protein S18 acetylase RimI-like enzyme